MVPTLQGCPYAPFPEYEHPDPWPNEGVSLKQALWSASSVAYNAWLMSVEHACLRGDRSVPLQRVFHVGPRRILWKALLHGWKTQKNQYDRSFWHRHGLQMPFEEIRRVCRKRGEYLVLTYKTKRKDGPAVLRFTMDEIMGSCSHLFTTHQMIPSHGPYEGRVCDVFVYGNDVEWHNLNVVPF